MLSATSISSAIEQGRMGWAGELRGSGLLLSLGASLQPLVVQDRQVIDLADQSSIDRLYGNPVSEWETYELVPGEVLLGAVAEPLWLGAGLMGMIGGLSHLARVGLAVHVTSPFVMPGWNGHLTLELVNTGPATLRLHHGMPVARLIVFALDGVEERAAAPHMFYGRAAALKSRYADEFTVGPSRRCRS
ncbi:dCTP deaminase [Streptomyces wedmorensis]